MPTGTPSHRFVAAMMFASGMFVASCSAVIGFPDRVLDETADAEPTSEGGDRPDVITGSDGALLDAAVDAEPPRATFSVTALDFGLVSCGAAAPAAKPVTITNSGGTPLMWTATLAPTPDFAIAGASSGTIAAGSIGTLTIASTAVSALTAAGDTAQGMLTITTSDAAKASTAFPIKRTAAGGTLTVTPLTAAFGETPSTIAAQDIPIVVKNTGNQPITIGFAAPVATPANSGFALTWTNSPASVVVQPNAVMPALIAKFLPTALGSFIGTSAINVTGALCGTNPSQITFTGKGTGSPASVQPGSLDFGLVDCGTTAAAKKLRIINSSMNAPLHWDVVLPAPTKYVLSATSGDIAINSFVEVTVTPVMVPAQSAVTPNLYGEMLTITTDAPTDEPHVIDLLMTARGAVLAQSAGAIDFGGVFVSSPATSPFTVSNSGNVAATVSYTVSPSVFSVSPQNQVVGAGANYTATGRFAPTLQQPYTGTAQMTVASTVLCGPLPPGISLTGQGALSAQVNPTNLDFGLVNCGATAAAKLVTLTNTSGGELTWTAALGTSFYTVSPSSGTLAKNRTVDIVVTPKAIPAVSSTTADFYADTLTITTTPTFESPYVASIHMTAQGAILSFSGANPLSFGNVNESGGSKTLAFSVVNAGNLAAAVTLSESGSHCSNYSETPTSGTANASSSLSVNATFNPDNNGTRTCSIAVATSAARCAPLPAALQLTGNGT